MGIFEQLDEDLKNAMRARDETKIQVLRMLKSDLRYKKIELGREMTEDDAINVLSSAVKRRRDSIFEYQRGNRQDLANAEAAEVNIIQRYLPEQMSEEELYALVDKAIAQTGARTIKDMGAVMKVLMPDVRGRADGKIVNTAVRARLEGK